MYGLSARSRLCKIQIQQNKALKAVYKLPYLFATFQLYSSVAKGILPLLALNFLSSVTYVHKVITNTGTLYNIDFSTPFHEYQTRFSHNICKAKFKNEYGRRRIAYIGPYYYNKLPDSLKLLRDIHKFKLAVKDYCHTNILNFIM